MITYRAGLPPIYELPDVDPRTVAYVAPQPTEILATPEQQPLVNAEPVDPAAP